MFMCVTECRFIVNLTEKMTSDSDSDSDSDSYSLQMPEYSDEQ